MALVLVATAGAANANSFATRDEADAYHESRLYSEAWTDAVNESKDAALVWATRLLNLGAQWAGYARTTTQALVFPRTGLTTITGTYVPYDVVPQEIKNATAELARRLLEVDPKPTLLTGDEANIKSLTAGPVSITFRDDIPGFSSDDLLDEVWGLIPSWWIAGGGPNTAYANAVRW